MIHLLLVTSDANAAPLNECLAAMGITVTSTDGESEARVMLDAAESEILEPFQAIVIDKTLDTQIATSIPTHYVEMKALKELGDFVSQVTLEFRANQTAQTDPMLEGLREQWIQRAQSQHDALSKIKTPYTKKEREELRRIAHTIRGTAQSFGFPSLGILSAEVEESIKRGESDKTIAQGQARLEKDLQKIAEEHA